MKLQPIASLRRQRQADHSAGVRHHEIDRRRRDLLRGHHQVSLVFAIFIVHEDDHSSRLQFFENLWNWAEGHTPILARMPGIYSFPGNPGDGSV